MNFNKILLLIATAGALAPAVCAETPRWVVRPIYQQVTRMSENLYKVKQGDIQFVLDNEDRVIISGCDSITPFCEGHALVLRRSSGDAMKLVSILREDKSIIPVEEEVFVDQFPFFSEGLLPVKNKKGKFGYMNQNGAMAIPFKFSNPHPFSEGLAAVSKSKNLFSKAAIIVGVSDLVGKDKVYYINNIGGEIKLSKEIGDIYFGSTFRNGEALVINKERQYCVINRNGQLVRIEPSVTIRFDDHYALVDSVKEEESPVVRKSDGPEVFSAGKTLGYRKGSKIVVLPQFSHAEPFDKGRAVATRLGSTGILGFVPGDVVVNMKKGSLPAESSDVKSVDMEVIMPKDYQSSPIEVEIVGKDGKSISSITDDGDGTGKHGVSLMLPKGQCAVRIISDNLEVWNSGMLNDFGNGGTESDDVKFAFSATAVKANAKDVASVAITITNGTSERLAGALRVKGATSSVKKVDIPAGGKKVVSVYFPKVTKKGVRVVTVSVGEYGTSRKITVEPFFNF